MGETDSELTAGNFCWFELHTNDGPSAKEFYTQLFGWETLEIPIGPDEVYVMFKLNGGEVAAMHQLTPAQQGQGTPTHWMTYVRVKGADNSAERAVELGAKIVMPPFDVMGAGRMAIIQDPQGAMIALWQPAEHQGATVTGQPNSFCWGELSTADPVAAVEFYKGLFGWTTKSMDISNEPYMELLNGEVPIGGVMKLTEQMGDAPPHWLDYFAVTNCDATVEKAIALGGSTMVPPTDIPTVGRFSVIADRQGAVFAVIQLNPRS